MSEMTAALARSMLSPSRPDPKQAEAKMPCNVSMPLETASGTVMGSVLGRRSSRRGSKAPASCVLSDRLRSAESVIIERGCMVDHPQPEMGQVRLGCYPKKIEKK